MLIAFVKSLKGGGNNFGIITNYRLVLTRVQNGIQGLTASIGCKGNVKETYGAAIWCT